MFFLAASTDLRRVMSELRKEESPVRRVVIAGGGNIGFRLAKALEKQNQVKLIERDPRRARKVSELLENTIVLNGDAADEELLIEEHRQLRRVRSAHELRRSEHPVRDAGQAARRAQGDGAHQQAVVRRAHGERQHRHRDLASNHHDRLAPRTCASWRRRAVHSLRRGAAEAIEVIVHGSERSCRVIGKRIEDISLPEGASIGAIVRGVEVIMAHHDTVIEPDDHVILFLADRRHIEAVEKAVPRRRASLGKLRSTRLSRTSHEKINLCSFPKPARSRFARAQHPDMQSVVHVLGSLLAFFGAAYVIPILTSLITGDGKVGVFLIAAVTSSGVGLLISLATKKHARELKPRDGFLLATASWVLMSASASVPLLLGIPGLSVTDAYFEAMSGLTTTGSTVLTGLDTLPESINIWRHTLHWLGGLGIIVLAVAILPLLGVGGMQLLQG